MASIRDLDISQIVIPHALEQLHLDGLQHMQYRAAKRCQKQELELLKAKEARGVEFTHPSSRVAAATRQQKDPSGNGDPALTAEEDKDEDTTISGHTATLLSTVALQQDAMMSGSWSPYFVQLLFRRGRPSGRP